MQRWNHQRFTRSTVVSVFCCADPNPARHDLVRPSTCSRVESSPEFYTPRVLEKPSEIPVCGQLTFAPQSS
jgi:hypothetical protein